MTVQVHAGFDFGRIGTLSLSFTESVGGGATAISFASGTYAHTDLSSYSATSGYSDFASALKSELDSNSPNALTYTVTFSASALTYSITPSSGNVTFSSMNSVAQQTLGFSSASKGPSSPLTSDNGVYYSMVSDAGALSEVSGVYEPDDVVTDAEAGATSSYSLADGAAPEYDDFTMKFNSQAITFADSATSAVPWAFEHFVKHVRGHEPFSVVDGATTTVHRLRARAARFRPGRVVADWNNLWDWRFETRRIGT